MPVLTELVRSAGRARVPCGLSIEAIRARSSRTRSTATTQAQRATARHAIMPRCSAAAARASRAAARGRPVALGPNDKIYTFCRLVQTHTTRRDCEPVPNSIAYTHHQGAPTPRARSGAYTTSEGLELSRSQRQADRLGIAELSRKRNALQVVCVEGARAGPRPPVRRGVSRLSLIHISEPTRPY